MKRVVVLLMGIAIICVATFFYIASDSTTVKCKESDTSTPYCMYKGKVKSVYVNEKGLILIGIFKVIDQKQANSVGFDIKTLNYFAYQIDDGDVLFGEHILSLSQTAIADDKLVEMHARGSISGIVKIDRIWLLND